MSKLPDFKRQPTPKAVVDEHLDALNKGDWNRLMAQYPDDVEIFLPGGVVIRGRQAVADAFAGMVKPFKDGGLGGVTFTAEHVFTVGDTVNVQWKADADFLEGAVPRGRCVRDEGGAAGSAGQHIRHGEAEEPVQ